VSIKSPSFFFKIVYHGFLKSPIEEALQQLLYQEGTSLPGRGRNFSTRKRKELLYQEEEGTSLRGA
jgi:hypothetical protein